VLPSSKVIDFSSDNAEKVNNMANIIIELIKGNFLKDIIIFMPPQK
jgi:hypothetical protein